MIHRNKGTRLTPTTINYSSTVPYVLEAQGRLEQAATIYGANSPQFEEKQILLDAWTDVCLRHIDRHSGGILTGWMEVSKP